MKDGLWESIKDGERVVVGAVENRAGQCGCRRRFQGVLPQNQQLVRHRQASCAREALTGERSGSGTRRAR